MVAFTKRGALTTCYYLITLDEQTHEREIEVFDGIGAELDPEEFSEYRNAIIEECQSRIVGAEDSLERYELISEGVDAALAHHEKEPENGVPSRMLLWDLLALVHADGEYTTEEQRLIKHIMRTTIQQEQVAAQMEQLMHACVAVGHDLERVKHSNMTYAQAEGIVNELTERQNTLIQAANALVVDEMMPAVPPAKQVNKDIVDKAGDAMGQAGEAIADAAKEAQKQVGSAWSAAAKTIDGWFKR